MSCEFFTMVNFRAKTMAMIDQANEILEEYAAQGFVLTLRQLYYQFVTRLFLANDDREYGRLGRAMTDARRAGLVDWDFIEDRTRELETFSSWGSPADILYGAAHSYQENLWLDQLRRPEVWIEKAALIGVMKPACEKWRVPHMAARGYPSHSELYSAGKRLQGHLEDGLAPVVFYLGDHDPSGLDMTRSLREELSLYARASIEVVRLGLNLDQVRELRLPPNPAKETDRRFEQYVCETGCTDSWELDALSPAFIDGLTEQAISDLVDHEAWKEALGREQANNDLLLRTATSFAETGGGP
ncbi:MAG: hypothetical protein CR217_16595 [Beijerinckiaceae bacterium]|nr:MAG: hypothetical protein CR217_16595 [Beijerinckiaceae bacterium]